MDISFEKGGTGPVAPTAKPALGHAQHKAESPPPPMPSLGVTPTRNPEPGQQESRSEILRTENLVYEILENSLIKNYP